MLISWSAIFLSKVIITAVDIFLLPVRIITKIFLSSSDNVCRDDQELTCGLQWKVIAKALNKSGVCRS